MWTPSRIPEIWSRSSGRLRKTHRGSPNCPATRTSPGPPPVGARRPGGKGRGLSCPGPPCPTGGGKSGAPGKPRPISLRGSGVSSLWPNTGGSARPRHVTLERGDAPVGLLGVGPEATDADTMVYGLASGRSISATCLPPTLCRSNFWSGARTAGGVAGCSAAPGATEHVLARFAAMDAPGGASAIAWVTHHAGSSGILVACEPQFPWAARVGIGRAGRTRKSRLMAGVPCRCAGWWI